MRNLGDDVWDTSLFYANQVRRVGKFRGKDFAMDAAKKKATEIADAPPAIGSVICGDDDTACEKARRCCAWSSPPKSIKKNS